MGRCTVTVTKDTALQGLRVSSHAKEPESRSFLLLQAASLQTASST